MSDVLLIHGACHGAWCWDEVAGIWDEYLATRLRFHPDVERTLTIESASEATMEVRGPEGFLQAYEAALQNSGIQVER